MPDFTLLKFNMVEGFSEQNGERVVQYVRISLQANNGRRLGEIPRIIEKYNRMDGRSETIVPLSYFPSFNANTPVVCFKATASIANNPILKRIAQAKEENDPGFWKWALKGGGGGRSTDAAAPVSQQTNKKRFINSIRDVLRDVHLPESVVPVQRVYDELSEPYFRKFNIPLGEGTGCIPAEHREFIVSEIKRLFEEELSYIEQPALASQQLPSHARALVDNAGWMGDILLTGNGMDTVVGGSMIRSVRVENAAAKKIFIKTGRNTSDRLERRGVGSLLREFLVFYALRWNDERLESVLQPIETLHAEWTNATSTTTLNTFQGLVAGMGLPDYMIVEGPMIRVRSVAKLLELLCREGLIVRVISSAPPPPTVRRMQVTEDSVVRTPIVTYFRTMLENAAWKNMEVAEVTDSDVVKVLNGGEVGAYRRSCVAQFMRPFMFDGSVEGYSWKEGSIHCEKYVVHIRLVAGKLGIKKSV